MKLYDILDWNNAERSIELVNLETNETLFEREFSGIRKDSVVIDVGARIGYYTVKAGLVLNNTGKVLAIEPHPRAFSVLRMNVGLYKLKNVITVCKAVSSRRGRTRLYEGVDSGGSTIMPNRSLSDLDWTRIAKWLALVKSGKIVTILRKRRPGSLIWTPVDTLDNIVAMAGLEEVDLVKIDVQGAELEVLKGSQRILNQNKPRLLIETHYEFGIEVKCIENYLRAFGYCLASEQKRVGSSLTTFASSSDCFIPKE